MKTNQSHNLVFFSEEGISSSQANYISNMIKEKNLSISRTLENTKAYSSHIKNPDSDGKLCIKHSKKVPDNMWNLEGKYYALSAWLKEAIKSRSVLIEFYKSCSAEEFLEEGEFNSEFNETPPVKKGIPQPKRFTDEDAIGELSIKERAEYLELEACASHLGKYIHPDGALSNIKKDLEIGAEISFHRIVQNGQINEIPMYHIPEFDIDSVNTLFFELQATHRGYESRLNAYKARLQNRVTERNAELQKEYTVAITNNNTNYEKELSEYNSKLEKHNSLIEKFNSIAQERRLQKIREVSAYKIVIPNSMKDIYQELDSLGK